RHSPPPAGLQPRPDGSAATRSRLRWSRPPATARPGCAEYPSGWSPWCPYYSSGWSSSILRHPQRSKDHRAKPCGERLDARDDPGAAVGEVPAADVVLAEQDCAAHAARDAVVV